MYVSELPSAGDGSAKRTEACAESQRAPAGGERGLSRASRPTLWDLLRDRSWLFHANCGISQFMELHGDANPPNPLPSGGRAMDLIPNRSMSCFNATKPDSMSSILLLPLQCRFVGKLMMY